MVSLRYKKLKTGRYSAYLDIYSKDASGKGKRNYEFLNIYVSKNYNSSKVRIDNDDIENIKLLQAIRNKRETIINFSKNGYLPPEKMNLPEASLWVFDL